MGNSTLGDGSQPTDALTRRLADEFAEAIRQGDEDGALRVLEQALANGLDGPAIYLGIFQPALERIGDLCAIGQIGVGDEHRATALTRWLMDELLDDFAPPTDAPGAGPLLAGCVQGEHHSLGLAMVVRFLRRDGWRTVDLGADVPESGFAEMAAKVQPAACLLSVATSDRIVAAHAATSALRAAGFQGPVLVGGVIFRGDPALAVAVGATATASDAAEAVTLVRRLVPRVAP